MITQARDVHCASPQKDGIPADLRFDLRALGARLEVVRDGFVVFRLADCFLIMEQFVYTKVVRVDKDTYLSGADQLRRLFEAGTVFCLPDNKSPHLTVQDNPKPPGRHRAPE